MFLMFPMFPVRKRVFGEKTAGWGRGNYARSTGRAYRKAFNACKSKHARAHTRRRNQRKYASILKQLTAFQPVGRPGTKAGFTNE